MVSYAPRSNAHTPKFTLEDGPIGEVHAFWLAGMSCDGCSISALHLLSWIGKLPPTVRIFGCEPQTCAALRMELSPAVAGAVAKAVETVIAWLAELR